MVNMAQREAVDRSSRSGLRRSAATVVSSEDYARGSRLWSVIAPHMVAIPPPVRPGDRTARPTYRRGDGFHVGFLGRIVEEKGVEHLVDAFRALDDPDARLLIGGEHSRVAGGSVVDRVRAHAGDDDRIELLGFVPDQRLGEFYASIDAFALPSVNAFEAFGIVQVVGMLAGVPALVSDLPGGPPAGRADRVRHDRARWPTCPALRDGLAQPARHPARRRRRPRAAAEAFSVESVLDAYEAVFTKAAG